MNTTFIFVQEQTRQQITVDNINWLPNLQEKIRIEDHFTCISGAVIKIDHEIYATSGTHYITITVE